MELYIKAKDGTLHQLAETKCIGDGDVVVMSPHHFSTRDIEQMQRELAKAFGRKVILLDARFDRVFTIPPVK